METYQCRAVIITIALIFTGCTAVQENVLVVTGTNLGVSVSQNQVSQMYEAKLGYNRGEIAFVPTDKSIDNRRGGAANTTDVLTEIRYRNIFQGGDLYQRLAVGSIAVSQPGATMLFAKGPDGTINPEVVKALQGVPEVTAETSSSLFEIAQAYDAAADKTPWDAAASLGGYASFVDFLSKVDHTPATISTMTLILRNKGLL